MMHKIWTRKSTIDFDEFFKISPHQQRTNGELEVVKHKYRFPEHTFANRIVKYWNIIPLETRNMKKGMFKKEVVNLLNHRIKGMRMLNIGNRDVVSGAPPSIYD